MSGLAWSILQGLPALTELARSQVLGTCQGRCLVAIGGIGAVVSGKPFGSSKPFGLGVYDKTAQRMVVFDGAALVALAEAETLAAQEEPDERPAPFPTWETTWVLDPPSRL